MTLLHTEQLTKNYGPVTALDRLDLDVAAGEIVGILGPNGSGKTTALRLMMGFLKPSAGRAAIQGHDCWADSVNARRHVSYLPGELRLYENMTGEQLIGFLSRLRQQTPDGRLHELAEQFDIDVTRPLAQMSSGMKRKIALMQVLLPRTPLVILDEPTNTLDPNMRDQLLEQLAAAGRNGQAVLFSSHVLSEVERICDRVAILQRGRLVHWQDMASLRKIRRVRVKLIQTAEMALPPLAGQTFLSAEAPIADAGRREPPPPLVGQTLPFAEAPIAGAGRQEPPPPLVGQTFLSAEAPIADAGRQECLPHFQTLDFQYTGPLPALLRWLGALPVADVHIEPMGLAEIYQKYHPV